MHSSCVRLPTCSDTLFQSSLYISSACSGDTATVAPAVAALEARVPRPAEQGCLGALWLVTRMYPARPKGSLQVALGKDRG